LVLPYATDLDAEKIHVQAPSNIVFLCGGQISSISEVTPLSLRDAFLKILENPVLRGRDLILAEDITQNISFFEKYSDILEFETDFAQIVELIILFCESEGSEYDILRIVRNAPVRYKTYTIQKRNGGDRIISQPARELKALQRLLVDGLLYHLPVHPAATAYIPGVTWAIDPTTTCRTCWSSRFRK
jgi:hypothetical protein